MKTVMRIKDWGEHFENSASRKLQRMAWVAVPLKHGTGYRRLLAHENGPALYGAWVALVAFAATCPVRGTFARLDGTPYSPSDIAIVSGFPIALIQDCLKIISNCEHEICWIESVAWENLPRINPEVADSPENPSENGTPRETSGDTGRKVAAQGITKTGNNKDQTGKKQNKTTTPTSPPKVDHPAESVPADGQSAHWGLVAERFRKYGVARVTTTITEAKDAGYEPSQLLEWLDWLEDPAHPERKEHLGGGVVVERIRTADARFWAAHENWPPADSSDAPKPGVYPYASVGAGRALDSRDSKSLDSLEAECGDELNQMSDLDVFSLMQPIREKYAEINMNLRRTNPNSRLDLLRRLKKRRGQPPPDS